MANCVVNNLVALVAHLDTSPLREPQHWREWHVTPVGGGANNLVYRAAGEAGNFAIKFTVRDDRDRAGREYAALQVLQEAETAIAPQAVWLEQTRFRQPVVVQTWLEGEVLANPPTDAIAWHAMLDHYCRIHAVKPTHTTLSLVEATINANSVAAGISLIERHLGCIPRAEQPATLHPILAWLNQWHGPQWPTPPRTLCRVDSSPRNFVIRPGGAWASVDWENSGWGDPAFEWADMQTHPAYLDAGAPWDALVSNYASRMNDFYAPTRIAAYTTLMTIWWLVRWARYLYEVPRGFDQRLVAHPVGWQDRAEAGYSRYLALAYERVR